MRKHMLYTGEGSLRSIVNQEKGVGTTVKTRECMLWEGVARASSLNSIAKTGCYRYCSILPNLGRAGKPELSWASLSRSFAPSRTS